MYSMCPQPLVDKSQRRAGPRSARSHVRERWAFAFAAEVCVIGLVVGDLIIVKIGKCCRLVVGVRYG